MGTWKLFLDDERDPVGDGWIICRDVNTAADMIAMRGIPTFVSFDHDLGPGPGLIGYENTGMGVARLIIDRVLDGDSLPDGFAYYVHSQNPIGAANIRNLLENFLENSEDLQRKYRLTQP